MSLLASNGAAPKSTAASKVVRPTANFPPTIWGDQFIAYSSNNSLLDANTEKQMEELKAKIRSKLIAAANRPSNKTLDIVDAIQRLGLAYQFGTEIEEALKTISKTYDNQNGNDDGDDLYHVALRFRLLRQQGYPISCDIFNKFKDNEGNFKESLADDLSGMLSLYEATHLRFHGEDILDEALTFTFSQLESMATGQLSPPLGTQVVQALEQPIRKGLPRVEARKYIPIYQDNDSHDLDILKLAKLDFNLVQKIHQKELAEISKWWKDLDIKTKLPHARDRIVELYFWVVGVYFEPHYSLARRFLVKVTAMTSIIDDTYDAYGTLDELELFTEAVERWEIGFIDHLPEYMKVMYNALLDVYKEIEEVTRKEGRSFCISYAKKEMKEQVQSYFLEAKWFNEGYVPTVEEYMPLALITCGYKMLTTSSFIGMGDMANKEAFDWATNNPKMVRAASIVCRLLDDINSHKFEQERDHIPSGIECYMKQHGLAEEEIVNLFRKQITDAWKDINEEFQKPTDVPTPLLERSLNLARVIDVMYKEDDGYTNNFLIENYIALVFRDPILV